MNRQLKQKYLLVITGIKHNKKLRKQTTSLIRKTDTVSGKKKIQTC